jgi:hypothetical protein
LDLLEGCSNLRNCVGRHVFTLPLESSEED